MGGIPKLKNMNLFRNARGMLGEVTEITLPKLSRKMEGYRAGGMDAEVDIDMGGEKLELEFTCGGIVSELLDGFGAATHDADLYRFAGAYQSEDTGQVIPVEAVVRGRYQEIDMGNGKPGSDTEHKYKVTCSYYKLIVNGREKVEIDIMGMIFKVNGDDRLAAQRLAIGL